MTSVPAPLLGPAGFVSPSGSAVLTGVLADLNAAFGGALNPALETPQGQLAATLAALIGYANDQFAYYVSQVDPAFAQGRMQDSIARIYFVSRNPAVATQVQATCSGAAATIIPPGALARATDGSTYVCATGGTISAGGSVVLPFTNTTMGPIPCPAGALSTIYQTVSGWDSITHAADGVVGANVESRADFEVRRAASVALNAAGTIPSVRAAVLNVPGVLDVYVTDNATNAAITVSGATIPAHALYVSVLGGDPNAVAAAIWSKKSPGCGYSGNTTVVVYDNNSGYSPPYPAYSITYTTASALPAYVSVSIASSATVPSNATALIQAAVQAAFVGADGGPRARIGSTVYASRFYAGIAALGAWAQIVSITIGTAPNPTSSILTTTIAQYPSVSATNIAVSLV